MTNFGPTLHGGRASRAQECSDNEHSSRCRCPSQLPPFPPRAHPRSTMHLRRYPPPRREAWPAESPWFADTARPSSPTTGRGARHEAAEARRSPGTHGRKPAVGSGTRSPRRSAVCGPIFSAPDAPPARPLEVVHHAKPAGTATRLDAYANTAVKRDRPSWQLRCDTPPSQP